MPLPNEVQQHIRSTIATRSDQLIRKMNEDRRDAACELAAKGLSSSSVRVQPDIEAIERFIDKRMTAHVEIYLDTLAELGIKIDVALEAEIVQQLESLRTAQNAATPPGMAMANVPSMQEMYRSRLGSADTRALATAKNRVRMARLKDAVPVSEPQPSIVSHTHHYTASGPNARVNVSSIDNSSNAIQTGEPLPSTETPEKRGWTPSDRLAVALCCTSGLMTLLPLWMEKTPIWAGGTVCALTLLVIYPVHHFIRTWKLKIPALIVAWVLIAIFGWKIWPRPVIAVPQPVVKNMPASPQPTITVPAPRHRTKSPRLTILQSSVSGRTEVLITVEERFPHPVFRILCSAPCTLGQSGAVSLPYRAGTPKTSDDSTLVTVPIEIPGQIDAGQQIYLDLLPKGDSPISILSVNGYPVIPPSKPK